MLWAGGPPPPCSVGDEEGRLRARASQGAHVPGPMPAWLLASQPHGQQALVCRPPGPTQWLTPRPAAVVCSGLNPGAC